MIIAAKSSTESPPGYPRIAIKNTISTMPKTKQSITQTPFLDLIFSFRSPSEIQIHGNFTSRLTTP